MLALAGLFCAGAARAQDQAVPASVDLSSTTRLAAVQDAERSGDPKAAAGLAAQFAVETEPTIRAEIVRGVARLDAKQGLMLAETALNDPGAWVRLAAVEVLGKTGGAQAVSDLSTALAQEKNAGVRQTIAFWLGENRAAASEAALAEALANDPDPEVRLAAAHGLKRHGSIQAHRDLRKAGNDRDSRVKTVSNGQ